MVSSGSCKTLIMVQDTMRREERSRAHYSHSDLTACQSFDNHKANKRQIYRKTTKAPILSLAKTLHCSCFSCLSCRISVSSGRRAILRLRLEIQAETPLPLWVIHLWEHTTEYYADPEHNILPITDNKYDRSAIEYSLSALFQAWLSS